ncbi:MAG: DUF5723 family protein [Flavobacteriales bacterium]|jgi:outer membrane protein OmpA-like peptidoglycan-associated protein|nr:DUF5723 family protein [Flavobacteriales bacterium]
MKNSFGLILIATFLLFFNSQAQQQFTGYSIDNFSGYHAAFINPALIADSRVKLEIGGSSNLSISNNFNALNTNIFYGNSQINFHNPAKRWYRYYNNDINILGLLVNLDNKNAFSYSWRVRSFSNAHGNSDNFSKLIFDNYSPEATTNSSIKNLSLQTQTYADHSISYARVLHDGKRRFFKAGATFKIINGINASYLYSSNADLTFNTDNTVNLNQSAFEYGVAENSNALANRKLSIGGDIGVVYEFRPEKNSFKYEMNGNQNKVRHDLNKYQYKLGVSLLNIGRIKYATDTSTYHFTGNNAQVNANDLFTSMAGNNVVSNAIQSGVLPLVTENTNTPSTFNVALPSELSIQGDYHIKKQFYVALTSNIPIWFPGDAHKSHNIFITSIIPRYEGYIRPKPSSYYQYIPKRELPVGIAMPISIQRNGQINLGLSGRIASFAIGFNNINPLLGKRKLYDANIFFAYKITIRHRKEDDFDEDQVSDDKDLCFYEKGDWRQFGCPDSDQDGIPDHKDYCPNNFGPQSTNGCPDSDKDGVLDFLDHCPDQKGIPALNGCPDSDKDGIVDAVDRCPETVGPYQNNGCPYPPVETGCCKDSDGDGVLDKVDQCPNIGGAVTNQGCPVTQPTAPTIDSTKTTPSKEHNERANNTPTKENTSNVPSHVQSPYDLNNHHFDTINQSKNDSVRPIAYSEAIKSRLMVYFGNDSHYIADKHRKELDKLLTKWNLGISVKEYSKVRIIGHTDNVGDDIYNLILSKKRVEAVKSYLINLGIPNSAIEMYYLGEDAPVTGNQNEIDKALNRRVEVIMLK